METVSDLNWFALRTTVRSEQIVQQYLRRTGAKAFRKTEKRARFVSPRAKKLKQKREPIIYTAAPGYVFVGLDGRHANPWMLVHGPCHMIRSVVSLNGRPVRLNPTALADFLGFDDFDMPDYALYFGTRDLAFAIGDEVRIDSPSFEGFTLPVKDIRRGEAIFDLVMMGRSTELRIPIDQCYPVRKEAA